MRSLGLESSFYLTTGTFNQIVKDRFRLPPERFVLDLTDRLNAGLSSKPVASLRRQALETNLSNLLRAAALCQQVFALNSAFSTWPSAIHAYLRLRELTLPGDFLRLEEQLCALHHYAFSAC